MKTKIKNGRIFIKTAFAVALTVVLFSVLAVGFSASAYYEGDFQYYYAYDGVEIAGYEGYDSAVIIPETIDGEAVVGIGEEAFSEKGITYVSVPDTVTYIDENAFAYCCDLQRIDMSANLQTVGDGAFAWCESLTSISLPSTVTSIGNWAFEGCTSLYAITIPENITVIGQGSFTRVPGLKNVTIPEGVTHIKSSAFFGCRNLSSVTIPASVTYIDPSAFDACTALKTVNISSGNKYYKSVSDCILSKDGGRFYRFPAGKNISYFTVPSGVWSIEAYAFADAQYIVSVTVPNGVTAMGEGAFNGCAKLTTVSLPSTVRSIGNYPFSNSKNLTAVNVNGGNQNFKSISGVLYSKDGSRLICYPENKKDAYFTMPYQVTSYYIINKNLTSIKFSGKLKSINGNNYIDCPKLTTVTIPKSVTEIEDAFSDTNLKTINYEGTKADWYRVYVDDSKAYSAKVNWKVVKASSIKLSKKKLSLKQGDSSYLRLTANPYGAACTTVYKSSNPNIVAAYSDFSGCSLYARALGTATVTATNSGKKAKCTVSVKKADVKIIRKKSKSVKYLVKYIKGYKKAKWSTSNSKIATVTKSGTIKAKKTGKCKIYCKIGKTTYTINVSVVRPVSAKVLDVFDSGYQRKVRIQFNNNTDKRITYITFNITQYNKKGKKIKGPYDSYYMNGSIYSGGVYTGTCTVDDLTSKAKISIKKVWFSDGSTWTP